MIQIAPQMRILVAIHPIDFRKGIDGICSICREKINIDPTIGYAFVFRNRNRTAIKILIYDGQGFWLCQKRLSQGFFKWWPDYSRKYKTKQFQAHELSLLIWNADYSKVGSVNMWKKLPAQHLRSNRDHAIVLT
jgi:transposase